MGLVQVAVLGGEGVGRGPELLDLVLLQAPPEGVCFPDVRDVGAAVLRVGTREHIHARTTGLRALGELLELGARDHVADAAPVRLLHDSHPLGEPGGHEQAQGEGAGGGHGLAETKKGSRAGSQNSQGMSFGCRASRILASRVRSKPVGTALLTGLVLIWLAR